MDLPKVTQIRSQIARAELEMKRLAELLVEYPDKKAEVTGAVGILQNWYEAIKEE